LTNIIESSYNREKFLSSTALKIVISFVGQKMGNIKLDLIIQDKDIQQRAGGLQSARVREYSKAMKNGDIFPPVIVYQGCEDLETGNSETVHIEQRYWLADGFHRCAAAAEAGLTEINAEVRDGTRRDALLEAIRANAAHGVRRTNEDKRKAVFTMLTDDEWSQWSDHKIAQETHTTQPFVSKLRRLTSNSTVRLGADGRLIDISKIGKSRPGRLGSAWENASDEERSRWVAKHRKELQALLRRTEKRALEASHWKKKKLPPPFGKREAIL
jgi:ParB-like chromosome segregation protein Spo0J